MAIILTRAKICKMTFDCDNNGGILTARDLWALSEHQGTPVVFIEGQDRRRLFARLPVDFKRCWIFTCPNLDAKNVLRRIRKKKIELDAPREDFAAVEKWKEKLAESEISDKAPRATPILLVVSGALLQLNAGRSFAPSGSDHKPPTPSRTLQSLRVAAAPKWTRGDVSR